MYRQRVQSVVIVAALVLTLTMEMAWAQSNLGTLHTSNRSLVGVRLKHIQKFPQENEVGLANLIFEQEAIEFDVGQKSLIRWKAELEIQPTSSQAILLTDGSLLKGIIVRISEDNLQIQLPHFGLTQIEQNCVAGVILKPAHFEVANLLRAWSLVSNQSEDVVYLADGSLIQGTVREFNGGNSPLIDGTQSLDMQVSGANSRFSFNRISAIRYSPVLYPVVSDANVKLSLITSDGTSLLIDSFDWSDAKQLQIKLGCGVLLKTRDVDDLCRHLSIIQNVSRDSGDYQIVTVQDFTELRGHNMWTRIEFFSQERNADEVFAPTIRSIPFAFDIVAKPAFRAKLLTNARWSKITGVVRLKEVPNADATVSDAFGQASLPAKIDSTNQSYMQIVALKEGSIVSLFKVDPSRLTNQPSTVEVDIKGYTECYFVVDTQDKFSIRTDIVFEGLRFCHDN